MFESETSNTILGPRNSERPRYDVYTTDDRRDPSADWGGEYQSQSVEPTVLVTDGGQFDLSSEGCRVCDHCRKNHLNDQELVVDIHLNTRAVDELTHEIGQTVAEVNQIHAADALVVDAVYHEDALVVCGSEFSLEGARPPIDAGDLREHTFLANRLVAERGGENQ